MDKKDWKILAILDMDARMPLTQIAKKCSLSREVVNYRIQQMEKNGIIEGYYSVIDVSKLGYMYCRILLKYRHMSKEKEKELLAFCHKSKTVRWISLNEGKWDLTLVVLPKNLSEIESFSDKLNSMFGKHFQSHYVSIAYKIYHFKHNYLYDGNDDKMITMGGKEPIVIDEIDNKILQVLSNNARLPLIQIAQRINSTQKVVKYRMDKLLKSNVILAHRAKINTSKLGYDRYKVFLNIQNYTKANEEKLTYFLRSHPNIIYITKPMGQHTLEFEGLFQKSRDLHAMLKELTYKFTDVVTEYDTLLLYDEPLLSYL